MDKIDVRDKGPLKQNVARRLTLLRDVLELNQTEFGEQIGVSQSRYSMWETADRLLPPDIAIKICETFGVTTDWLYRGDPNAMPMDLWKKIRVLQSAESARSAS